MKGSIVFRDSDGRPFGRLNQPVAEDGTTVKETLTSVDFCLDGRVSLLFRNRLELEFGPEPQNGAITVWIQVLRNEKPCEELLKPTDRAAKRDGGEPEDGRMSGVSLEKLTDYITSVAMLAASVPLPSSEAEIERLQMSD